MNIRKRPVRLQFPNGFHLTSALALIEAGEALSEGGTDGASSRDDMHTNANSA